MAIAAVLVAAFAFPALARRSYGGRGDGPDGGRLIMVGVEAEPIQVSLQPAN